MSQLSCAILGGSFDPVHIDHIRIGCYVQERLNYSTILFIPAHAVPLRATCPLATSEQRLTMLRNSLTHYPRFQIDDIEIQSQEVSYISRTVPAIKKKYNLRSKIGVIIGADLVHEIPHWKNIADIAPLISLIIMRRDHQTINTQPIKKLNIPLRQCTNPLSNISSSAIRRHIAQGESFRHLVPATVYEYIIRHNLYV